MTIKIKVPYYSAGYKYGFRPPEGIGIKSSLFRGEGSMEIKIGKDRRTYWIDRAEARDIVRKYHSFFWAGDVKLAVLPKSALRIKEC